MKVLKIEKGRAYYSIEELKENSIKDISAEDIKEMINIILTKDAEIDDNVNDINNPAEKIIYEKIHLKIKSLLKKKTEMIDKINKKYSDLYEKYDLKKYEE